MAIIQLRIIQKAMVLSWATLCLGLTLPVRAETIAIDWNSKALTWHTYDQGTAAMQREGKPSLLILYANWCPTCKAYAQLFQDSDVINALAAYVLIAVDIDQFPAISARYDFDGEYVPRTLVVDRNGQVLHERYRQSGNYRYYLPSDDKQALLALIKPAPSHQ